MQDQLRSVSSPARDHFGWSPVCRARCAFVGESFHPGENRIGIEMRFRDHFRFQAAGSPAIVEVGGEGILIRQTGPGCAAATCVACRSIPPSNRSGERHRTGIGSLKVRYNSVFGYYIEITKANLSLAPSDYERKQTLVNAERFTTPELKEYERKILTAHDRCIEIEKRIFASLRMSRIGRRRQNPAQLFCRGRG